MFCKTYQWKCEIKETLNIQFTSNVSPILPPTNTNSFEIE